MYTSEFDYFRPSHIQEALALLEHHPDAKLLAGGHSLISTMKLRLAAPSALIDVSALEELRGIRLEAYLQTQSQNQAQIITPIFKGVRGHPVLFARAVWPELLQLRGDSGGKAVIEKDPARAAKLERDLYVPKDVDTLQDLQELENPPNPLARG